MFSCLKELYLLSLSTLQVNLDRQARKLDELKAQPHAPGPQGKAAKQKKVEKLERSIKIMLTKELGPMKFKQSILVRCSRSCPICPIAATGMHGNSQWCTRSRNFLTLSTSTGCDNICCLLYGNIAHDWVSDTIFCLCADGCDPAAALQICLRLVSGCYFSFIMSALSSCIQVAL